MNHHQRHRHQHHHHHHHRAQLGTLREYQISGVNWLLEQCAPPFSPPLPTPHAQADTRSAQAAFLVMKWVWARRSKRWRLSAI